MHGQKLKKDYDINEKELLTIFYILKSFMFDFQGKHSNEASRSPNYSINYR